MLKKIFKFKSFKAFFLFFLITIGLFYSNKLFASNSAIISGATVGAYSAIIGHSTNLEKSKEEEKEKVLKKQITSSITSNGLTVLPENNQVVIRCERSKHALCYIKGKQVKDYISYAKKNNIKIYSENNKKAFGEYYEIYVTPQQFANFLGYGKVIEITLLPFDKEWLALKVERILTEEQTLEKYFQQIKD